MKEGQRLWTEDEVILAINLYCKLPFGKMHNRTPEIKELAKIIERTPDAVARKLGNLASLDPSLQERGIKGLTNNSKLDKIIWNRFYNNWDILPFESEKLLAKFKQKTLEEEITSEPEPLLEGLTREAQVQVRVNQSFFRTMIMASYNYTCCITGIKQSELLIAGHIKPWGIDPKNRLNPQNGISINALHDKAFENGLITITPDYIIKISNELKKQEKDKAIQKYFIIYDGKKIIEPSKFLPGREFLEWHLKVIFRC